MPISFGILSVGEELFLVSPFVGELCLGKRAASWDPDLFLFFVVVFCFVRRRWVEHTAGEAVAGAVASCRALLELRYACSSHKGCWAATVQFPITCLFFLPS